MKFGPSYSIPFIIPLIVHTTYEIFLAITTIIEKTMTTDVSELYVAGTKLIDYMCM